MLSYYINDIAQQLGTEPQSWHVSRKCILFVFCLNVSQNIEASLHCIMSIQEAVDLEKAPQLARLFSQDILGRLPTTGHNRLRRTTLSVIGAFSFLAEDDPK